MEQDLATLQVISDTLKEKPEANQRTLAENTGMSIGLMNAVLKRFAERGWIMLSNVNGRKLAYALTAEGISELTKRAKRFAVKNFSLANECNEKICTLVKDARHEGKDTVLLYGESYIKFLIVYACEKYGMHFEECNANIYRRNCLCLIGELSEVKDVNEMTEAGWVNLVEMV